MINRIYIDNFRCLVNFEIELTSVGLFLGPNGSGKSTVFEVLRRLQSYISGNCRIEEAFPTKDLTRWQNRSEQRFELDVSLPEGKLSYLLVVEHSEGENLCRVKEEKLTEGSSTLFNRKLEHVFLFRDDGSKGPDYPYDWTLSALVAIQARRDNSKLTAFKMQVNNLVIAAISPSNMEKISEKEAVQLSARAENFISWYRRVSQENMASMLELFGELTAVLDGFVSFSFREAGESGKILKVMFKQKNESRQTQPYDFSELSDGQRALIALYALLHSSSERNLCLFLDEPDNFVSIKEIQPWLASLREVCGERLDQAVLISHHPEIIDSLGPSKGYLFAREPESPTRILASMPVSENDGLTLSEILARGWEK